MRRFPWVLGFLLSFTLPVQAQLPWVPGEWPAWRGPDRDGLSREKGLLQSWPPEGPKLVWKINGLGEGYSTPSVAQGMIFLMGTHEKEDYVYALKSADGSQVWKTKVGKTAGGGGYPGPRSTPTVDGELLYTLGSEGDLVCAQVKTGEIVWRKNLRSDFKGRSGGWAYTESPLIDGDWLLCTPGGDESTLIALKKINGDVVWKSQVAPQPTKGKDDGKKKKGGNYSTAAYSSIIIGSVQGQKQYIQFLSGGVVGINAADGKYLWHYDHPRNGTANITTPVFQEPFVFAASAYGTGGGQAKIQKNADNDWEATETFFLNEIQNHHGGLILLNGFLYGTGSNSLMCIDFKTGKIVWNEKKSVGKGSICYADGHLVHRSENGPIALVEANPEKYVEKGRFVQPDRSRFRAWPHPVIAGGRLYIRDADLLLCYDVKGE